MNVHADFLLLKKAGFESGSAARVAGSCIYRVDHMTTHVDLPYTKVLGGAFTRTRGTT